MSDSMTPKQEIARLRLEAQDRLKNGTAAHSQIYTPSVEALRVLYELACTPDTAGDGLKLLHELQTFQVELDMQHEQLLTNERESSRDLDCYRILYDMVPCACFILSPNGCITDCNMAGARLFGIARDELCGRQLNSLVTQTCQPLLGAALERMQSGSEDTALDATLIVTTETGHSGLRSLRLLVKLASDRQTMLMTAIEHDYSSPA
ncbi:MAG: PAS domain-containing protein [Pseudohongiellaceae bacterium]